MLQKDAGLMLLKRLCSTTSTMELLLASTGVDCADVGAKAYDLGDDEGEYGIKIFDLRAVNW